MSSNDAIENHLEDALAKSSCGHTQSCELSADVGQIQATQSIVNRDCHNRSIVDVEGALLDALLQDTAQNAQFAHIETTARMFKLDDIAEELGLERAIADHRIAHLVEAAKNIALQLLVGWNLKRRNLFDGLDDMAHLTVNDSKKDLRLRLEICIESTPSLLRVCSNLVHRRIVEALGGKQLTGYFDKF